MTESYLSNWLALLGLSTINVALVDTPSGGLDWQVTGRHIGSLEAHLATCAEIINWTEKGIWE